MKNTQITLKKYNLPTGDTLIESKKLFNDGSNFKFEVPGIQSPDTLKVLIDESIKYDIFIHRVTQTKGIMLLTDSEIEEMVRMCGEFGSDLILACGPRSTYDTSACVHTDEGISIGLRLRGQNQMIYAIEDIKRGISLGCLNFLIYDEGLLWLLNKMRNGGDIPGNIKFKISAHCGHGNPCSFKLLEENGADSINAVRDIQIPMISSIRQCVDIPIDVHVENPLSSGGFIRHYEVCDMIKYGSPINLKIGGYVAKTHNWQTTKIEAEKRFKQVILVKQKIDKYGEQYVSKR